MGSCHLFNGRASRRHAYLLPFVALTLLTSAGCISHRIYAGFGGGYGRNFRDSPLNEGGQITVEIQGTPHAGEGLYLGVSAAIEAFVTDKRQWFLQLRGGVVPGYRVGPVDLYLKGGFSSLNFDQSDGRFGFGMFSPYVGGGVIFQLNKRFALGLEARLHYLLRFNRNDAVPYVMTGLSFYFWSESKGYRPLRH